MAALLDALRTECDSHVHSSSCGHATIAHGDHVDYIVGTNLHHVGASGCSLHGEVRAVETAEVVMATTASRFVRRRGGGYARLVAADAPPTQSAHDVEVQSSQNNSYRFMIGLGLTACFMIVEFVVGLMINSLALQVRTQPCAQLLRTSQNPF